MKALIVCGWLMTLAGAAWAVQAGGQSGGQGEVGRGGELPGVTGTLRRHENFASKLVAPRHVDVWLPPGYERERRRYPVLYMHDGQNLFDPKLSYTGVDWGVDEAMTRLISAKKVRPAVVVAVWNTPRRVPEYMPQRAIEQASPDAVAGFENQFNSPPLADAYLSFLVAELKPFIDSNYRTLTGRADTFVMGSSMGGLISLYAAAEYPKVFGGVGAVSTHWPAGNGVVIDYLKRKLPKPGAHRFYYDFGTATLDAEYEPFQRRTDELMRAAGYREGRDWVTRKFEGAAHDERAWRDRLEVPLIFLLGRR
ncbi:MAG TPA: alpha/beta hydrolase-fold protein [Pyrinomonadaceae bacterium]|nr:alpha/beta hydrolase-fold protein [Pyrinomonadaceae bacterium]